MPESLEIAIAVLSDWRVIAVAVGTIAIWALFRYVGSVYRRPKLPLRPRAKPVASTAQHVAKAAPPRAEVEEGEEMVE